MNNDEFLKRLSEVAEWERPQVSSRGQELPTKKSKVKVEPPPVFTEAELDAMSDEEAEEYYEQIMAWRESQPNLHIPPRIIKLKVQDEQCGDCGLVCKGGRRLESKLSDSGQPHWRHRCMNCGLYKNPETGEYTLDSQGVHMFLGNYYRKDKKERKRLKTAEDYTVVEKGKERLRKLLAQQQSQNQDADFHMVPYDNGDSVCWRREPISGE